MNYKEKYEKALEWMKSIYPTMQGSDKEDAEHYFPELKESEDERIRKTLVAMVQGWADGESFYSEDEDVVHRLLAWLEKQKERKPAEKQDYSELNDLERAIHRGFLCAGVEDVLVSIVKETAKECIAQMKPTEWTENDEEMIRFYEGHNNEHDYMSLKFKDWLINRLKSIRPQPKQEWSEKDKTMLNNLKWAVHMKSISPLDERDDRGRYVDYEKFLESLPERFNLEPKPEWSEEDIKKIRSEEYTKGFNDAAFGGKLKEWSEEDEAMIKSILFVLESFVSHSECASSPSLITTYPTYHKEIDWLKSLRPSWKPSYEQIEALRRAVNKLAKTDVADSVRLSIMYDNLKKLM